MKNRTICMVLLILTASVAHADWVTRYQTDFSTDPGWTTSDPANYFWNGAGGNCYIKQVNINHGGNYAYHDVGYDGGSFKLDYDIKMVQGGYASAVSFGLYDTDLNADENGSFVQVLFVTEDRGQPVLMNSRNASDVHTFDLSAQPQWTADVWYRVSMEYHSDTGSFIARVTDLAAGTLVGTKSTAVGPFGLDMDYLGTQTFEPVLSRRQEPIALATSTTSRSPCGSLFQRRVRWCSVQ